MIMVLLGHCVEPRRNCLKIKTKKLTLPCRVPMVDHDNMYNDDLKVFETFWRPKMIHGGLLGAITRNVNFGFLVAYHLTYASAMSEIMSRAKLRIHLPNK